MVPTDLSESEAVNTLADDLGIRLIRDILYHASLQGLSSKDLTRRMGVPSSTVTTAFRSPSMITLQWLAQACCALGLEAELAFRPTCRD